MSKLVPKDYAVLLAEVKDRVRAAQYAALKAVNKELVALYWDIGSLIAKRQQGGSWGISVVRKLAADLREEFPGIQGFSDQNVWYMRQFFLAYRADEKLQPLVGEVSWSKNLVIKMQFYLAALDAQIREAHESPSIGIILCKEKNRTVVEYALHDARKPIGVATYRTVKRLPKELKGQLPAPEEIIKLLEDAP